jgi:hypothetical protein
VSRRTRRPRRRITPKTRRRLKAVRTELRTLRRDGVRFLGDITTTTSCPHCSQRPRRGQKAQHAQAHAIDRAHRAGDARRAQRRRTQEAAAEAARPENRGRTRRRHVPTRPGSPHTGQTPPTVHIVDDDEPTTTRSAPWTQFDRAAEAERLRALRRENRRRNSRMWQAARWARRTGRAYRLWQFPPVQTPPRPAQGDGWRWRNRTTNPGGNAPGTRPPAPTVPGPPLAPVIPIVPPTAGGGTTPVTPTGTTGGGTPVAGTGTRSPRTKPPTGGGSSGGGGGASCGEIAAAGQRWAQTPPETLSQTKADADNMGEALAGLADAFVTRQNVETDRSIAASCVEPYQEAAHLIRQAQAKVEEVHSRLNQRYGEIADELAKPDTPEPDYLKEGRG